MNEPGCILHFDQQLSMFFRNMSLRLIALYLCPGLMPTVSLGLSYFLFQEWAPSLLVFLLVYLLMMVPLFMGLIHHAGRRTVPSLTLKTILSNQQQIGVRKVFLLVLSTLFWAVMIFALLGKQMDFIKESIFSVVPAWFDLGDYLLHKEYYSKGLIIFTWILLAVASIVVPVMEEIYFRGFLLFNSKHLGKWSPVINTLLFSFYHFWSIWLFPIRVIALFPMVYVVWRYRNIYIGMIVHCTLNLVGDVILTFPFVFS